VLRAFLSLGEELADCLENAVRVVHYIIVPEPEEAKTLRFDKAGAPFVIRLGAGVLTTIKLNDQLLGETGKVGEVGTDRHLSPPFAAGQLGSECTPQALFRFRRITTKLARSQHGPSLCFVVNLHLSSSPFRRFAAPSLSLGRGIYWHARHSS
jgi:hypothetical protein